MKKPLLSLITLGGILCSLQTRSGLAATESNSETAPVSNITSNATKHETQPANASAKATPPPQASVAAPAAAQPPPIIVAVAELSEAGVEIPVIEAYLKEANVPPLRPDDLIYLRQRKVTPQVTTALIQRSVELRTRQTQALSNARERYTQQQATQAAQNNAAQNRAPATPRAAQQPLVQNYYVNNPPPAYNWGNQFYPYGYVYYPYPVVYYYNYGRAVRSTQMQPNQTGASAQRSPSAQNPNSSFFISRWQWIGNTGKPVDNR